MAEAKDPTIKLFGMTIPLQEISSSTTTASASTTTTTVSPSSAAAAAACHLVLDYDDDDDDDESGEDQERPSCASYSADTGGEERGADKDTAGDSHTACMEEDEAPPVTSEKSSNPDATSLTSENPKTPSIEKDSNTSKTAKTEDEQSDTSNSQEKTLKKPDKVIPCPRCNSMDTKFCYYNNYNVNQPRHFCKNCQRYWTAGGTMRNVPVGAGRRKNKNSASHYRHITIPEGLPNIRNDVPNGIHHPALKTNGTVLSFGSETPLHESMDFVLNLADKPMRNCTQNGFHKTEALRIPVPHGRGESGDAHFSSVPSSNTKDEAGTNGPQEPVMQNYQGFPAQMPCFPGGPWPYPWGSPVPPPGFCPPGYPMPFYPAPAYWGCTVPGTWNIPWLPQSVSPKQTAGSGPNSPTLGKHSRDEIALKANNSGEEEPSKENSTERSLWIPKTLRIDDPGEAAKSSIWTTLGIKHDTTDTIGGKGLFKAFQSKSDEKKHTTETSPVLQANPAAMSRSLKFQESS